MFIHNLPFRNNSFHYFKAIAHLKQAVWIDSCREYQSQGRFDIISAEPDLVFQQRGHQTYLDHQPTTTSFLDCIKQNLTINPDSEDYDSPFTHGILGLLCYDFGWQLEHLPRYPIYDIDLPDAVAGYYDWSIVTDFDAETTRLFSTSKARQQEVLQQLQQSTIETPAFQLQQPFRANFTKQQYIDAFNQLKQHLHDGDCYQANLCQRFESTYTGAPLDAYRALRQQHPAAFAGFLSLDHGALLSLSPERFIACQQGKVKTQPIKGTIKRYPDPQQDQAAQQQLQQSEKDRAENTMIVDLMRNDLSRLCQPHSVKVPTLCELQSFSHVHHLVSTITATLKPEQHPIDLFQYTFPGGSITGCPKISAMSLLTQLEPQHRSAYCGSLFYLNAQGNLDSNIVIRSVICNRNRLYAYAGGGIVYDSTAEAEYDESLTKISAILSCLEQSIANKTHQQPHHHLL